MTHPDPRSSDVQPHVSVRQVDGAVVVAAAGAVDLFTAPSLEGAVNKVLADRPAALVIDLTEVDFLASVG